jgi:hypothetical protein
MNFLILLLAFFLPPTTPHRTVTSTPPVVVSTLALATAHFIDEAGVIYACADQRYGLYVEPVVTQGQQVFIYVIPPQTIHEDAKTKFIATCLLIK